MAINLEIIQDEADRQGWTLIAWYQERYASGRHPCGVIAFVRHEAPFDDRRCGTVAWYAPDHGSVVFWGGHYDMNRDDAMNDFVERASYAIVG